MDRDDGKVAVQLLRLVVRTGAQTIVATFRCADGSSTELEMTAGCASGMYDKQVVPRALHELVRQGAASLAPAERDTPTVPSVPVTGCRVLMNEAGLPALLFNTASTSQFAVQLCQKSAAALIGELTEALNAQPPPGKRH